MGTHTYIPLHNAYSKEETHNQVVLWDDTNDAQDVYILHVGAHPTLDCSIHIDVKDLSNVVSTLAKVVYDKHPYELTAALEKAMDCALYFIDDDKDSEL